MIPKAHLTAWQKHTPWVNDAQIEQDLILSRIICEIYSDKLIAGSLALRGGTALQKFCFPRPLRYSEDLDFVQIQPGPIGPVLNTIRKYIDPWLGDPMWKQNQGSVKLIYKLNSEIQPITPIKIKLEINTREHFSIFGYKLWEHTISND